MVRGSTGNMGGGNNSDPSLPVRVACGEFQQETCGLALNLGALETDGWHLTTGADASSKWLQVGNRHRILGYRLAIADRWLVVALRVAGGQSERYHGRFSLGLE
jgi:hypothetical protein